MNTNRVNQMELGLEAKARQRSLQQAGRRQNRQRAQWWFSRMRQVVGSAMEWAPETDDRPVQNYLALSPKV